MIIHQLLTTVSSNSVTDNQTNHQVTVLSLHNSQRINSVLKATFYYRLTKTSFSGFSHSRKCAVTVSSVTAVTETTTETDASLTAVTVAETDVTTNKACEIVFFISHASFYFYCR